MKSILKRIFTACLLLTGFYSLTAQNAKTEYFMGTSFMRTYLNPALHPDQGQLLVPILPNISTNIQTNTINLDHLTFKRNGERVTFIHPLVSNQDFLGGLNKDNYIRADFNYKLFALGTFIKGHYTNFDIGVRANVDMNIPKSAFELIKVGFDQNKKSIYDLKDISATAVGFVEIGASQARKFMDNTLTVGLRTKFLLGIGYVDLNAKSLEIEAGPEGWRALSHVTMKGAAPGVKATYDEENKLDGFDFGWDGMPGYGGAIDLGVVYDVRNVLPVLKGLKVSASINDLGFIYWTKQNSLSLYSPETEVTVYPNQYHDKDGDNSLSDVLEDAFDDLKEAVNLKEKQEGSKGRTTSLRMSMHLGAEYEFIENKLSAGALYSNRIGNYYTSHELTISGNYRPVHWLNAALSYSFMHSKFDTFGFALHLTPRKGVTFFLASDYIIPHVSSQFIPTTSKGLNLQLGFSIPIGSVQL